MSTGRMKLTSSLLLLFLGICSQISRLEACDSAVLARISQQPQFPEDAINYLPKESFWRVLSNQDAKGSTLRLDFKSLSAQNTVEVDFTFNGKTKSKSTYKYKDESSVTKEDGSTVYLYICSDKMIGLVECQNSGSTPILSAMAKMVNPLSDVAGEIAGCEKRMNDIYPSSTIQQLAHP